MWNRYKEKIDVQTFPHEKEMEFQKLEKEEKKKWDKEIEEQKMQDGKDKAVSVFC